MKKGNFEAVFKFAKTVLIRSLSHYLQSHRRLVIPQLGAFLVKEPGGAILFSELLKRDDGVLRGLLRESGLNDLEAAGEIDRFVFEVRHAIQSGTGYPIPGLGRLQPGPNGTIAFVYNPAQGPERAAEGSDMADGASAAGPESKPELRSAAAAEVASEPRPVAATAMPPREPGASASKVAATPADPARGTEETSGKPPRQHTPRIQADQLSRSVERAFAEASASPSSERGDRASSDRGSRDGRRPKTAATSPYPGRAPRRRADRFLWIAIAAALIALAAIGFGYWREHRDRQEAEAEYLEYRQMIHTPNTALETGTVDPAPAEHTE